jgi:hypothetical protein
MTAYPGFEDFQCGGLAGRVRYAPLVGARGKPAAWVGATEPIAPISERSKYVNEFFKSARQAGARAFFMPVSENLTEQLQGSAYRLCVGAEPIFDLQEDGRFHSGTEEVLKKYPRARALVRAGYQISSVRGFELMPSERESIERLAQEWRQSLRTSPMGFLNQVDPWVLSQSEEKRFFLLKSPESRLQACIAAVRVPLANAWYFAEVLRSEGAPSGAMPCLILGAMEILAKEGAQGVRLGMAPLAYEELTPSYRQELKTSLLGHLLLGLSTRDTSLYGFSSAREFKRRLRPSRWEPLFVLSSSRPGVGLALNIARAHFPRGGVSGAIFESLDRALRQKAAPHLTKTAAVSLSARTTQFPLGTIGVALALSSLHMWKIATESGAAFFQAHSYSPGNHDWMGWICGPLFHNHAYHLTGDVISFILFGAALEWFAGFQLLAAVMAFGFWATNPLGELVVRGLHSITAGAIPAAASWMSFLAEKDYGSSNAVYAFVGALAVFVSARNRPWLWLPFALNGIYLCFAKESWLSLHHLVGLAGGAFIASAWLKKAQA